MKISKFSPLLVFGLLATLMVNPLSSIKEVKGSEYSYDELVLSQPSTIKGDYTYEEIGRVHMNSNELIYFNIADSTTTSITYEYGFEQKGNGQSFYLDTPGGGFSTMMRVRTICNNNLSTSNGLLFYADLSEIKAEKGDKIEVGIGLVMMDSQNEPPYSSGLFDESVYKGHFRHYYPLDNQEAYYYDILDGGYKTTTTKDKCVLVSEGFKGWVYIPLSIYSWNSRIGSSYTFMNSAFGEGYDWLNYAHLMVKNVKADDAQSRLWFDEMVFVKQLTAVTKSYVSQYNLNPTCSYIGGEVLQDSATGDYQIRNSVAKLEHNYSYTKFKNGAIGVCSHCGDLIYTEDSSVVANASTGDVSNFVDVHFHYGKNNEKEDIVIINKQGRVSREKEPRIERITKDDGWKYDFSVWTSTNDIYTPVDPKTHAHTEETHYYASYLIESYDNTKYSHVPNLLAINGGRYNITSANTGKIVMNGNSNFALAYNTVTDFAYRGLPLINNAVAGGSTYDYYYYSDQLVIGYRPKILVFNLTTNDQAYWSMSEKDIIETTEKYILRVHQYLPDCQIAIVNASPLPGRSEMFATVERLNETMKSFADKYDFTYYIDTYEFVYTRMLEYPDGWEFWTHMDTDTLSTWMNLIADGIQEIVDEKGIKF